MSVATAPIALVAGEAVTVNPPMPTGLALVIVTNLSPLALDLHIGSAERALAPWQEAIYEVPETGVPIQALPSVPMGATVVSGASSELYTTWFTTQDPPPRGQWPVPLVANAIASSSTIVGSNLEVFQSSGANLHTNVDNFPATQPVSGTVAVSSGPPYSYHHLATNSASDVVKSGAGRLHSITVNDPGSAWSITVYDNTSASGTVIAVLAPSSPMPFTYDVAFGTGLTLKTAGTTPGDLTVAYA